MAQIWKYSFSEYKIKIKTDKRSIKVNERWNFRFFSTQRWYIKLLMYQDIFPIKVFLRIEPNVSVYFLAQSGLSCASLSASNMYYR